MSVDTTKTQALVLLAERAHTLRGEAGVDARTIADELEIDMAIAVYTIAKLQAERLAYPALNGGIRITGRGASALGMGTHFFSNDRGGNRSMGRRRKRPGPPVDRTNAWGGVEP